MKLKQSFFPILLAVSASGVQAATNASNITIQGGNNSSVIWRAPLNKSYKVSVFVGNNGSAANALYHVYPKGNMAGNTTCSSTDANYPCFEIAVNQAVNAGKWVQLTLNNDIKTAWQFFGNTGYVSVETSNLSTTETLDVGGVQFNAPAAPDFKTLMRARWKDAIATTAALKSAITQCLIENVGVGSFCDSPSTKLVKYGVTAVPAVMDSSGVLIGTVAVTTASSSTVLPHIHIFGSPGFLGGCSFQLIPTITWNTTANFKISWDIKATAFLAPATSNTFCTNFVPYSTAL
jgi:hypothetical protein